MLIILPRYRERSNPLILVTDDAMVVGRAT